MLARSAPRSAWVALAISMRRWSRSEVTASRRETSRTSRILSAEMVYWRAIRNAAAPRIRERAGGCKTWREKNPGMQIPGRGNRRGLRATGLVLRTTWVDVLVPEQDAAGHGLHVLEALLAEELGELERACAATAVDDDFL